MADVVLADVSMDLDSQEEREVHDCDVCHVSYTTDVELRDHHWSLMHHIKMEKQKKGSVHNCTLCFMTCANIIEYGKHLNEEKHKRAVEDCRRQREEEDLLMGKDVLMARIKEKEEQEKSKQRNRQKGNQAKKKGSNNLSDPESSRNNAVGKRRSERTSQRKWGSGSGHQRSFSLPGQNVGQRPRNPHWERQSYNDDFQLDSMANNFQDPSWTQWNGNYGNIQHEQWNMNMGFQQNFHEIPNQNYQQRCYDNGQYNMQGHLEDNGWEIDRRGMRGNVGPGNKKNRYSAYHNDHNFDPNFPYELMNASGFPEESWGWGEDSYGFQDEYSLRDRSRWDRRNPQRNNLRKDGFRDRSNRNQESKASHNEREQKITQDNKNKEKPLEKLEHIHTDTAFRTTGEVSQSNNRSGSPSSERYLDSMRENRNRSDSYEKGTNKRRRYNSPARSTERRSRQDKGKEPKNTHIKFEDDEDKSSQHEGDSVTSSGDKEELSSGSSGKKGEKKEKKKSILKKKKKNGSKGSPPGSPKRSSKKVREEKGGEGVLEKAEKLCRELREKREKAKLEREKKMKMEQMEKLENINQELKTLSDKSKEYVKGHIPTEEIRQTSTVDSSAKERTEKETKNGNILKLGQCNKDIDKIRQNIEKSVQSINETQKLLNSAGTESKSEKNERSSRINKSQLESVPFPEESVGHSSKKDKSEKKETSSRINKSQLESIVPEASVGHSNKKEASAKPDSQKTSKTLDKTSSSGKSKEKLTTDSLLKMVNSPRSRKERQQLAGMLRSYAQSQKKLSLPRYNLQLSGSYDDNFDNKIEELRLEELSREVQIQIAQLMEADVTPDLNDLEMALMSSTAKKSVETSDTLETDTSSRPGSFYVSALDQFQELDRALQGSSKERPRTMSTDLDKLQSKNRKDVDSSTAQPLKMSDLSSSSAVIVKSEPMDTGHEKAAQGSISPDSATSLVTSTTSLGETGKTLPTPTAVPSPRMPQSADHFPQRSSTQMDASLPTLSGSLSSLESGRSTESIFDTVYDISIKEESLRKDLNEVEQFITYFRNVIDEATVQLSRYNEKKLRLQSEEEKLRGKRLRILHEVKIQQRSGRSTPQLSELEDQIRGPALEDSGKAMTPSQTSHNPDPQVSSYNDPHTSTLLNVLNRNQRLEPERDRQVYASSFGTSNSSVLANPNSHASDSIFSQLRNLSSSLQQETISMEAENKLEHSLCRDLASVKKEPEEDNQVTSTQGSIGGTSIKDKSLNMEGSRQKLAADRNQDQPQGSRIEASAPDNIAHSLPPKPVKSTRNPVNKIVESSDPRKISDVTQSTELNEAGFITLNSLIKTSNLKEEIDSDDEPLANLMRRRRQDSQRSDDSQRKGESDENEAKKFNMQYMGTLGVDNKAFLTQLGRGQGSSKGQGPSYMVLDKDTDAYQHIQSLIKGGRPEDKETDGPTSLPVDSQRQKDHKGGQGKTRSLRSGHVSDSNYESVNSNCSLGEQIRQYANLNKKGTNQSEENVIVVNTDSDSERSDRTLREDPALLSDSCTPVRTVKSGLQNLNLDSSPLMATSQQIRHGREEKQTAPGTEEARCLSPFKKKLRTKKERDRISVRKQKEGYVLDSSSDGGNSQDGESAPKLTDIKQQLVFKSLSNIPAALRAEGLDSEEAGLVETGSEDTEQSVQVKQEVIPGRSLLEDVQLETESEDNKQLAAEARERLSLDKEVMENFRKAVENMKSTLGLSTLQIPEDHLPSPHRDPIQYIGPKEVISGVEVLDGFLYVSYQGKIIKRFNLQTGELDFDFNTMSYNVSCILVYKETNKLYVGAQEMMLLTYCCKTKKPLKVEPTEGKPQCFLESWGHLYIGTDCGTVVVMSLKNDKVLDTFHCADRSISRICSATEGVRKVILVASFDAMIYVYDSSTGLLIRMLEGHTKTPFTLQVDGHLVYSGSGDKTVMEHNILTGELLWTFTEAAGIVSCVCTHDDQLFCASYDKLIRCYSKKSRKLLRLYYGAGAGEGLIIRMRISDGMLITGNRQGLTEAVPITQQDHSCQCSDCSNVFALRSHLVYHVVHDHILNNVRAGKKTPCPWRNCKERFQSTAPKDVIEEHVIVHAYS
ncbi:zinc finger protein 106-like [Saccostrea echinata]|uniref:zinc finger protein 106-like n=1 Tax=Saccostrea echinata TaxID=191078 RepID=UPI002A7F950C|nr:zinc finger protein 106-like [Saccostrea echinata]